mgnify:CR=1 FL=1|tara:strand:+ start:73 stop:570 length:498 start_codon:yes stop_codon:yes gene_type:complete
MLDDIKAAIAAATDEQVKPFGGLTAERFKNAFNPQTRRDGSVQINIANLKSEDMNDTLKTYLLGALHTVLSASNITCNVSHASRRTMMVKPDNGELEEQTHWVAWPCVWVDSNSANAAETKKTQAEVADLKEQVSGLTANVTQMLAMMQAQMEGKSSKKSGTPVP